MSGFARRKRITDPLDDEAKARLVGVAGGGSQFSYDSSGSEHSADSPCLSELVHGFLEIDEDIEIPLSCGYESDSDRVNDSVAADKFSDFFVEDVVLRSASASEMDDPYRKMLLSHVLRGMEMFYLWRNQKPVFTRKVMSFLREVGHNAAVCKTKWESSGGVSAGNYEFIDVVMPTCQNRYIVDLDYASQFEIARPTSEYWQLLQQTPRVFVGKNEDLKRIIVVMCNAAKRSLKSRELSLPPWRKNRYMQNKWFGPYRRTSNPISGNPAVVAPVDGVKCRHVGFDDPVVAGHLFEKKFISTISIINQIPPKFCYLFV